MRWVRDFFHRVKRSEKRRRKARREPRCILGAYHRRLCCEPLEDRRLLTVYLPSGLGDWFFYLSSAESNLGKSTALALFQYEKSQGVTYVMVKAQDGTSTGSWGFSEGVVQAAHQASLKIYAYSYVYGNYYSGSGEANELSTTLSVIASTTPQQLDGWVIDAEVEYQNQPTEATAYASGIKSAYPNLFLAYAPFPIIDDHTSYPYLQFGKYCDAVMPQAYFETGSGYTPAKMLSEIDSQWSKWDNTWATGGFASSVKPIIPICQAYNDQYFTDNGRDLSDFVTDFKNDSNPATSGGYQGVNFFDADNETSGMRTEIKNSSIGIAIPTLTSPGDSTSPGPTVSGTSQTFTWNKVTNATGYSVQLTNVTTGSAATTYTISSGSTTSYTVSGLIPGDSYSWTMYGYYNSYQTGVSTTNYFKILALPATPTGLTASATGAQISVSWNTVSGATSYTLDRSTSSGSGYTQVYSGSTAQYTDGGLQFNTAYYYEVSATNGSGSSALSSAVSATTQSGVPTALAVIATGFQSTSVTWNTVTGVTGYTLDRSTSSGGPWTQVYHNTSASYADSGLQSGTTYYYEISSYTGAGSAFSSPISVITVPATPTGLSASATGAQISLTWSTATGATSYTLDRSTSSGGPLTQVYSGSTAQYTDGGLQFNTAYYYEVSASNGSGSSVFSSPVSATTLSGVPTGLSAVATDSQSTSVTWNTVIGVTGYTLDRSTASGSGYVQVYSGPSAQFADGRLQPDTTYYYEVGSYTSTGDSVFSSPISATTLLATPTGLSASATGAPSITVSWNVVGKVTGFTLDRSTSPGSGYVQVFSGSAVQYADSGLQPDTTYYYEVCSYTLTASSAFSPWVSVTTPVLATWTGGESDNYWGDAANWGPALPGGADTAKFAAASYTQQPCLSSAASVGGIWGTGAGAVTIGGPSALTLVGTNINGNPGAGIEMDAGAGPLTVNAPLVLQNNQQWINNSASPITVNGPLSGAGNLTLLGSGTVKLSGNNNYTGGIVVTAGTLIVTTSTGLAGGSNLTVGAGALDMFGAAVSVAGPAMSPARSAADAAWAEYGRQ